MLQELPPITAENYQVYEHLDEVKAYEVPIYRASFVKQVAKRGNVASASVPMTSSLSMDMGTAVHVGLLEPHKFDMYKVRDWDLRTTEGKRLQQESESDPYTYLKQADYDRVQWMVESVRSRPAIVEYLDSPTAKVEFALLGWYAHNDIAVKSMVDLHSEQTLLDVKTTRSIGDFNKAFFDLYYDIQMAIYALNCCNNGFRIDGGVKMIVVENEPPFQSQLVDVPADAVTIGFQRADEAFDIIREAKRKQDDRVAEQADLIIPHWLRSKYREDA
tara:strand:- start:339 stop:1160 length:822 start_codon:yes stop_codon:yes gene_type:complete